MSSAPGLRHCGRSARELEAYLDALADRRNGARSRAGRRVGPGMADRFDRERAGTRQELGSVARRVEHFSSTAMPDPAAKPIVDMLATVPHPMSARSSTASSVLNTCFAIASPDHRGFPTPDLSVHVYALSDGDEEADRYLAFRDPLRCSSEARIAWEHVRRELATPDWQDIPLYGGERAPGSRTSDARRGRAPGASTDDRLTLALATFASAQASSSVTTTARRPNRAPDACTRRRSLQRRKAGARRRCAA
jgi:GrpB-like predicted nucleotidyltransferase (UPF0157 family)